jgi:alkylhydroperoxidase family enzyme
MTWLAIDRRPGESELSTLLALQPDTARALRDLALAASAALDPTTLALCARRAAHLHGVGTDVLAELVPLDAPPELVAELDRWTSSDRFDERTRRALRFAEQYAIDHTAIDQAEIDRLLERFDPAEVFQLATAFGVVDRILRVCRLLDVRGEGVPA